LSATLASAVLVTSMRLVASHAYAEGAPPGFSGGFKEESCHACHFHSEPNSGPGRVAIEGVPSRFTAGERYTLIVTLTQAGMKRAGFQATSRFKDTGAQAGTLAPAPDDRNRIGIDIQGGVQYAGQRKDGASVTAGEAVRWTIQWTAPDGGGPVAFNVAANAADGNESADGDFVYTTTAESASSGALALPSAPCPDAVTALRHDVVEPVVWRIEKLISDVDQPAGDRDPPKTRLTLYCARPTDVGHRGHRASC
jgi:hypothetical protein